MSHKQLDPLAHAEHRDACEAARTLRDRLVALERGQPSVSHTDRTTHSTLLAAVQKRFDEAYASLPRFDSPTDVWRWEGLRDSLGLWTKRTIHLNPHEADDRACAQPTLHVTSAWSTNGILVRGDASQVNLLEERPLLLEVQRAIALLYVMREALCTLTGLKPPEFDCLIFGNHRARPFVQSLWQAALTQHSTLWHRDNKGELPARGKPFHELPMGGAIYVGPPTPFCDLPLYNPNTGDALELIGTLNDPRNMSHPPAFVIELRETLKDAAFTQPFYRVEAAVASPPP